MASGTGDAYITDEGGQATSCPAGAAFLHGRPISPGGIGFRDITFLLLFLLAFTAQLLCIRGQPLEAGPWRPVKERYWKVAEVCTHKGDSDGIMHLARGTANPGQRGDVRYTSSAHEVRRERFGDSCRGGG